MTESAEKKAVIYEFGKFVLDPHERILLADGKPVRLADKVFDTLLLLVEHNGRLLTKEEMINALWQDSFVEEGNLVKNISRLRKILNLNGDELIETLPKHGYRFLADVKEIDGETSLLVRRNLRVKITHTVEDETDGKAAQLEPAGFRFPRPKAAAIALGGFSVLIISVLGIYLWQREKTVLPNETGAIRLTDNPKDDNHPTWTNDGRIRFLQTGSDRQTESVLMNADGTNQAAVKDFNSLDYGFWSPDGTKVIFAKPNDKTAFYLANADRSNETVLPFFGGNFDWSPDSRKIAYQKKVGENDAELFIFSLETRQSENITNNPAFDADPSFSPDGRQMVFASLRDGNAEIYVQNLDGTDVRRLTDHPAWDSHPFFSPDGTQIVFPSNRDNESSDLYLMRADGSDIRRLTDWQANETVDPGCWSPDGTKIVFSSDRHGQDDIFMISAEIYRPRLVLTDDASNLQFPSFSPDGKQIVYQAEMPDKSGELRFFDAESKENRVLMKTENADIAPVFSPDGEWIAFQNRVKGNTDIFLIKKDGTGVQNLTNNPARDVSPSWSPDGKQIAFASNREGDFAVFQLYSMNADGSNPQKIHNSHTMGGGSLSWSPDGSQIVFTSDKEDGRIGNYELFTIKVNAEEPEKRLTVRRRLDSLPAPSPDGKYVAFVSNSDGNPEVYLMNSDGTGLLRITRNQAEDTTPRFSEDSKRIIFSSNRNGKFALYEISLAD